MAKHRVAQVGCGPRGRRHIEGFQRNPDRFDLVALCDINEERLAAVAGEYGIRKTYPDAERMLTVEKPDIFCFVTPPKVRLALVELGLRHGVRAIAFEKPMATSLAEARRIRDLCAQAGVKFIVSHQQKYGEQWHKARAVYERGEIGDLVRIHASSRAWLSQLGTHLVDYTLWFNRGVKAKWVVGHVHGRKGLTDSHPSPDYVEGEIAFENGVRAFVQFGCLSPQWLPNERFWTDNRITLYGTHGYAWANTDGDWAAFTKASGGEVIGEALPRWPEQERGLLQAPYLRDLADWLDDESKVHPCNGDISYHGFEIISALLISALEHRRVDLPLAEIPAEDEIARLARELPEA
jgi:predicted dehydrogenase